MPSYNQIIKRNKRANCINIQGVNIAIDSYTCCFLKKLTCKMSPSSCYYNKCNHANSFCKINCLIKN